MFRIGLFFPEQVKSIAHHEVYEGSIDLLYRQAQQIYINPACHTVTLYLNEKPEAIFGLTVLWDGNADVWTLLSKEACRHPISLQKAAKSLLERYSQNLELRRISAATDPKHKGGSRWLESLGFQREGTMRKYGPDGSDWDLYARVF